MGVQFGSKSAESGVGREAVVRLSTLALTMVLPSVVDNIHVSKVCVVGKMIATISAGD
jgi:hypothetical protein